MASERKSSGSTRMYELGKKPIPLWVTPEELSLLQAAAQDERRPVSQFVKFNAMQAARKVTSDLLTQVNRVTTISATE